MRNEPECNSDLRSEIDDLRKIIAEKNHRIDLLEHQALGPVCAAVLTQASIEAGAYYAEQKYKGAPIVERQLVVNSCAHGFFMGYRKAEENLKLKTKGEESV